MNFLKPSRVSRIQVSKKKKITQQLKYQCFKYLVLIILVYFVISELIIAGMAYKSPTSAKRSPALIDSPPESKRVHCVL